ncbi:MAG: hydantoinase B/oxoprolinase family protein [Ectothiorhodospiraceae bacterium]|nr:hydantoinase B/oxoprolinase family protein [Chromatiales bacterium]MCP5155701.1 hydantoinase B/oxoprolinase family protein [Ectothiorhodospiraceae bacterium]
MAIDRITLQILANHCAAATESMAHTLFRTAHSTFVKETEDFTTGLATPDGKTFASPYDLGATWFVGLDYGRAIALVDEYEEGDICMTNDPYSGFVCTHSPDVHLWKPIFHQGELVCFAVGHVHNTDVGGAVPASLSRANFEVHQEGIRFPPSKLYKRGELNRELLDVMLLNVRMPEQNWGDLKAQIAAMHTGERKVHEMIRRFGIDTFRQGIQDLLDYAEEQARLVIRRIPDGEYFFADYMDEDAVDGKPCRLAVSMRVAGDEIEFDFSESDPQVTASLNIPTGGDPRHVLLLIPYMYVMYTADPTVLLNSGLLRPARCVVPEGSIVNPQFPAAVGMRSLGVMRLMSCVFGAFAQALPDLVPAACGDGGPLINLRTTDSRTGRKIMANLDPITGGAGAVAFRDGTEGSGANFGFLKNTPVEINEAEVPVKILRYGLACDSGGAGRWRGGTGTTLEFQVFSPNTVVTARNRDRTRFTPWGAMGGFAGKPSSFFLNPDSNHETDLGNTDVVRIGPGDVIRITSSGAGGFGSPLDREPSRVLADVERGFVGVESARDEYGVVIVDGAVDVDATDALRAQMRAADGRTGFGYNAERVAFEGIWTRQNYTALTEILARLPVDWRFFVKHRVFEALEAMAPQERRGDGAEVRAAFRAIAARYPELEGLASD